MLVLLVWLAAAAVCSNVLTKSEVLHVRSWKELVDLGGGKNQELCALSLKFPLCCCASFVAPHEAPISSNTLIPADAQVCDFLPRGLHLPSVLSQQKALFGSKGVHIIYVKHNVLWAVCPNSSKAPTC